MRSVLFLLISLVVLGLALVSSGCGEPGCDYTPGTYKLKDCGEALACDLKQNQCNLQIQCGKQLVCNGIAVNKETNLSCTREDGSVLKAILSQGTTESRLTLIEGGEICFGVFALKN